MITDRDQNNSVRLSLTTFGKSVKPIRMFSDSSDKSDLLTRVQTLTFAAGQCARNVEPDEGVDNCWSSAAEVNFYDALMFLDNDMFEANNTDTREILLVLTAGRFNVSAEAQEILADFKKMGRFVFVVAVGDDVIMENLRLLVNDPAYIFTTRFQETPTNLEVLAAELFYSSCALSNDF